MKCSRSSRLGRVLWLQFLCCIAVAAVTVYWLAGRTKNVLAQTSLGGPLAGLTSGQQTSFTSGQNLFIKTWSPSEGLGPVFTATGCSVCHFTPVVGGMGSATKMSTFFGTTNSDGSFDPLTNKGGTLLQPLTIQAFSSKSGACPVPGEVVPAGATFTVHHMPPQVFGAGLIDAIPDSAILANAVDQGDGILGTANMVTDYTGKVRPGRFGRKSQFASLIQVVAGAFEHDLGITNPVNPNKDLPQANPIPSVCVKDPLQPNDSKGQETISLFNFASFLAPNPPAALSANAQAGIQTFISIGCAKCHVQSFTTAANVRLPTNFTGGLSSPIAALSSQTIFPYSDFLLHDMGPGLADNMPSTDGLAVIGNPATGSQWRTAPLWGLSTRTLYLHDGRTSNLTKAIQDHGGEATTVISNFNALSATDQANLIAFLNSL